MSAEAFEARVERMAQLSRKHPTAYRRRVFALAALGYAYLIGVILLLLILTALAVASVVYLKYVGVKLAVIFGGLLYVMAKAMVVKFEPPKGESIDRNGAPALFDLLDRLRAKIKAPRMHEVIVTGDLNASIMQRPRLGIFGWHYNSLQLGLPLMKVLSTPQLEAVLAHELGHLSRGHARASNWIYRLRRIWQQVDTAFESSPRRGARLIRTFIRWYAPYFNAASFPLARANEYEADATSVQLTSTRTVAQALTGVHVMGSYLEEVYWPSINAHARELAQPSVAPYQGFLAHAVLEVPEMDRKQWIASALSSATSCADTHPSLADRLKAIDAHVEFVPPGPGESADQLLGAILPGCVERFDGQWRAAIAASWAKAHESIKAARERLEVLRVQEAAAPLDEKQSVEMADLEESVGKGHEASLAMRREQVSARPDSLTLRYSLARQLLQQRDVEGVALMESVIEKDQGAMLAGASLLRDYYASCQDRANAEIWHQRFTKRYHQMQEAQAERDAINVTDRYIPSGLNAQVLARMAQQTRAVQGVRRVYILRKDVKQFPESPLYVLGFRSTPWWRRSDLKRAATATQALRDSVDYPGETFILCTEGRYRKFERCFRQVGGSRIV